MKKICFLIALTTFFPLHLFAQAVPLPQVLNFDGQLLDSSNNPISSATVTFEIYDGTAAATCLLYKEVQNITTNNGEFSTKIGPVGTDIFPEDGDIPWAKIFANSGEIRAVGSTSCSSGYTPAAGQGRKLRVTVNSDPALAPDFVISPVPMATVAETLQGKVANDFLLATPPSPGFTSVLNGNLRINNNRELQFTNSTASNFVSLNSPAALATNYSLVLPMDDGVGGQVLTTDGAGILSWTTPAGASPVTLVFGRSGNVVQQSGDYTAPQISRTGGGGGVSATNVEAAIVELGTGKISSGAGVITAAMIATNAVTTSQIADGTITTTDIAANTILNTNIADVGVNKISSAIGQYLTYAPNGTACALNETLRWNSTNWVCHSEPNEIPSQTANAGRFLTTNGSSTSWSPNLIDVSGNIGIGTASPGFLLHMVATSAQQNIESTSTTQPGRLMLSSPKNSVNMSIGDIVFQNISNGFPMAAIKGITDPTGIGNGALVLSTGSSGSVTEKMRINNAGQVGIGVPAPSSMLDVNGLVTVRANGVAAGEAGIIHFRELLANGQNSVGLRAPDLLAADFQLTLPTSAGTTGQVLQTDGTGLLSWVTPAIFPPADSLDFTHFVDTMTLDASTEIAASGTNVLSITNTGTGDSFLVSDSAADVSPFVVAANGDVGIGIAVPLAKLDVAGNVKLGVGGTPFSASGLCVATSTTYAADTPTTHTCTGVPPTTNVAVHCSPSIPVLGYINARATGTLNQIAITLGVPSSSTTMTCMWMAQ